MIPKDNLLNKDNKLEDKDLTFLEEVLPEQKPLVPDTSEDKSIETVESEKEYIEPQEQEEILLAGIFPKNFKIKKKTLTDKSADDLTNKELGDQQQEQLKTKTEGETFVFEQGTGKAIFSDFSDDQMLSIEKSLQKFGLGDLDPTKKRSLKFIFDELDADIKGNKLLDANKFSDLVTKFLPKSNTTTIKDIMEEASNLNRSDVYMKLLKLKEGQTVDIPTMVRGVMEAKLLYLKLRDIGLRAAEGKFTELDKQQFYQLYRLWGSLYAKTAGDISARASGMRVIQSIDKPTKEGAEDIMKLLEDEMGADFSDEGFQRFTQAFVELKPFQAGKMVKDSYGKKLRDAWAEVWVNSMLSSPITHAVNVVGNTTFNTLRIAEYAIAAGINKVPGMSGPDGVAFSEVMQMIRSMKTGTRLGFENMTKAIKSGGQAQTTKLDLRKTNAFGKRLLPEGMQNNFFGKSLEFMGSMYRLPGTALVAEDEFMKGILYRMELERIGQVKYNEHLKLNPNDVNGAEKIFLDTVNNPNNATVKEAEQFALEGTFQQELPDGVLKKFQSTFNIPEMKLFVPFYKTITNIFLESSKRNPVLMAPFIVGNPKLKADFLGKNGKRAQQLMLAKLSTGTSLMIGFGMYAYGVNQNSSDFMITGMAPFNKTEREMFYREGLQPYSLCEKKGNTFKCTSYSRFDPVSSLLAISADFAYLSSRPDQYGRVGYGNEMANLAAAAIGSIFPYLTQQPFLTGLQELSRVFQPGAFDPANVGGSAFSFLTEKVSEGALALVPGNLGSFGRYLQRMQDNTIYQTDITMSQEGDLRNSDWYQMFFGDDNETIPLPIRKFYKSYNGMMLQSPFFNEKLRPKLNFWGEPIKGPEQGYLSPIRVKNSKYKKVDEMLVKLGFGIAMPRAYISGIPLNQDEYYQYIKLMNKNNEMLDELNTLVLDPEFFTTSILEPDTALNDIQSVVEGFRQEAQELFLADPKNKNFLARKTKIDNMKNERVKKRLQNN